MNIKIFNIATQVIYLIVFNEFLYQNKFVLEKHIKFVIETYTYKIYWIKKIQDCTYKNSNIKINILKRKKNLCKIKKKS